MGEQCPTCGRLMPKYRYDWAYAESLMRQGLTLTEVARKIGASPTAVRYRLLNAYRDFWKKKRVSELLGGGMSPDEVSRSLGDVTVEWIAEHFGATSSV